ncbi:hypothetical protein VPH35_096231 [Triticum aestivum]|uniref:Uncharacterized protein n=1 Tax=Aegilops tauschii TaxID=37682 RepID=M8CQN0_AEGTA
MDPTRRHRAKDPLALPPPEATTRYLVSPGPYLLPPLAGDQPASLFATSGEWCSAGAPPPWAWPLPSSRCMSATAPQLHIDPARCSNSPRTAMRSGVGAPLLCLHCLGSARHLQNTHPDLPVYREEDKDECV